MFNGSRVILYSPAADEDRAFIRDHLGFANVDAGDRWLIFKLPPAEIAVHPTGGESKVEFYFMCDDVDEALETLATAGATVSIPKSQERWGLLAEVKLPSGTRIALYQPTHPVAFDLP